MVDSNTRQAAPHRDPHARGPARKIVAIIGALLVIALVAAGIWQFSHPPENLHILDVSGRLEGYETNLGPKIGGRLDWVGVREGNLVKVGQVVAKLSDADYQAQLRGALARIAKAEQAVQQAKDQITVVAAQIAGASKRLGQSKEETRAQIDQAQENLNQSKARHDQAVADEEQAKSDLELSSIRLGRYANLVKKGAVTKDEYDQSRTTYSNNQAIVKSRTASAQATLTGIRAAQGALAQAEAARFTPPIRASDVDVFQAQRDQAQHQLEQAKDEVSSAVAERDQIAANIAYLNISSPINGVVTARTAEPGAVVVPGQTILTVIDYSQVYMRAFVPEGRIGSVRVGHKVDILLDAFPNKPFSGRVIEIDPEASFTPENIYFKDDRVKQVFGIKVAIDKPEGYAKPGMPADAKIKL